MKKREILYLIIIIELIFSGVIFLNNINILDTFSISKFVQIAFILSLSLISYKFFFYIKKQYKKNKYSYKIINNTGLFCFFIINIIRQVIVLILNWNVFSKDDFFSNILDSFSFFIILTLPCIIILSIYSIIANGILIKKEGYSFRNLLGVFLGLFAIIGLFGSQFVYEVLNNMFSSGNKYIVKKIIDIMVNVTLTYFYSLIISSLYYNIKTSRHIPKFDKDFIIILGSMIRKDGSLTPILKARVDRAIEFSKLQKEATGKDITFITSGGKGADEVISEAEAMKRYLNSKGIDNVILEDKSKNTIENMKYSNEIIQKCKKDSNFCFSTTNYHVFRSGVSACKAGVRCDGIGSKVKWYFYANALIREFIASLFYEKKKHFIWISLINIMVIIFIVIGYLNGLFI